VSAPAGLEIVELAGAQLDEHMDAIVAVYSAALGEDPAVIGVRMRTEVLPRHRQREAFRFFVARVEGRVVGISYGYIAVRGQWWTERVAAAMSDDEQARWLNPRHFEVVELHVHPDHQRRGIGARLLRALLDDLDVPFALLSTAASNVRGRAFYRREGWTEIAPSVDLSSARGPYVVLARDLAGRS
jgi:ribosomal protein S18 acetylase RimI-like enzyme